MKPRSLAARWASLSPLHIAQQLLEGTQEPIAGVTVTALESALAEHLGELRARFGRVLMGWALIMNVLWWPTDWFLTRHLAGAFGVMTGLRLTFLLAPLATLMLLHGQRVFSGARLTLGFLVWLVATFCTGYGVAAVPDLAQPWFNDTEPLIIATLVVPVSLRARVPSVLLVSAALLAGFLFRAPQCLHSPYLPTTAGYLAFTAGVSIAFGQAFYLVLRSNLHHRMALEAQSAELSAHRERLAREVRERTADLRLLSQHLEHAGEEEGRRIARELHDELGQGVAALRLSLSTTRRRFARNPALIGGNLDELDELIARVSQGTRQAIAHLRPQLLDHQGLASAAAWLTQNAERRGGITCALHVEGHADAQGPVCEAQSDPRTRNVHTAIFRVLQESLTNVLVHSSAERASVTLRFLPDAVELDVRDDGVGLPAPERRRRGMGLLGMRERATSLDGELRLEALPEGGTRVWCRIPLAATRGAREEAPGA